ncbi:MAG: T9SS type A sorting domain-containing protein [Salibacteraceae bacterium]
MKRLVIALILSVLGCSLGFAQSITVTSPNGGEVWAGCTSKNITWTATGTSNFYTIDYSTDGGVNWTSVTSFLSTTAGSYSWTVPNINSSNCIVRIKDSNTPTLYDESNNSFTITAPLILTSPNGGEQWEAGKTKSITWAATGTSNRYKIEYSTNSGSTWNTITSNTYNTTGIYNWNVANSPSANGLVRVTDYYTSCMTDKSDNLFTIDPPTPTLSLSYPNGYQTLYSGKAYTISWSSTNLSSNLIALDYSIDSGNTWTPIVTGISNSGSHSWTVPNTPSAACMIKVKAVGKTYVDSSNNYFTIKNPYINVLTPNGGENWEGCNSYSIRWAHGGVTNNRFNIRYSTNGGSTWTNIATNVYQSSSTNSSYSWSVPNTLQGSAIIQVQDYNNSLVLDESDTLFNLSKNSSIIVTSPNGGEQWEAGKSKTIYWVDNGLSRFRVYYSANGGSSWSYITSNTYNNYYTWSPPNTPGSNYKIRVQDYYTSCKSDESDTTFTVTPPTPVINVTAPNGNTVYPYQSYSIRWSSAYLTSSFVKIEYSTDSGSTWNVIQNVTNNDGAESWTVPNTVSNNCFVRVSEYGNPSLFDINTTPFKILAPHITLTSPVGGETWTGCNTQSITWSVGGGSGSYLLEYSDDSMSTWNSIVTRSSTSYSWKTPSKLSSTKGFVRVTDNLRNISDTTSFALTFNPNTDIIVTSPNGGESWEAATSKTVSWVDNGRSQFRVYYSTNGGSSWSYINSYTTSNSQSWSIPNNPGNNFKVKVQDYYDSCINDESDSTFTVTPPTPRITVTAPNGGSVYPQQSYNIRWTSAYLISNFVNIDFSSDSGTTWTSVVANTSNDGTHTWSIPNSISTQCFIRVSEAGRPTVFDLGNKFTISQPFINLTSPNGGEVWKGCESKSISWSVGGGSGSYRLEYSLDSGATWSLITTRNSTSYTWTIPSKLSSSKAFLRVVDASRNMNDASNSTFTIIPNTDIIVTTPNGGESYEVGKNYSVQWVDNNISQFRVYYSSNNGSSWSYINSYTTSNYQSWTIPNNPGNNYKVKVVDYYNSCKYDESDSVFVVTPPIPTITVTRPNSGNNYPYQNTSIRWVSSYLNSAFVKIEYTSDSGATWNVISNVTNNDGTETWQIPNTISNNYFVRVSEYGTPSVADTSDQFAVVPAFIELNSPNGGEVWKGCETKTISWTVGGGSNSYRLEYSLDSGATWTYITNTSGTSYNWSLPSKLSSTKAMFRIQDNGRSMSDVSNSVFNIIPNTDIIITSPNGGESWEAAKTKVISWVDNNLSSFRVYYSTNNGSTWSYVDSYTTSNSESWTVPNNPGSNYKIKVQDYSNSCKYDESDSTFTVTPPIPTITVTAPNGTTLYPQQSYNIRWTSAYLNSSFVNIEFSSDSAKTWSTVVSNTSNDGTHTWSTPNSISNECFIRVSEVGSPTVNDIGGKFTIAKPFLVVNSPNGGELWTGCESKTLSWTVGGGSGTYRMEYSLDSGATWVFIGNRTSTSYSWSIPTKLSSTKALIRISDNSRNLMDTSNYTMTLVPNQDIIVSTPNGGEQWEASQSKTITWVDNNVSRFRVYYSANNGSSWSYVNSYVNYNYTSWSPPNTPGSNFKIKVQDYYNSCRYDESDTTFTITPPVPYLTLTSPNGGNVLYQGQSYNVRWSSGHLTSPYVRLDYSLDSGLTWNTISNVTNNDGSESWTLPNVSTTKALVRVSEYGNPSMADISNAPFTIQPSIVLTAPNGNNGQNDYRGCTVTSIKWDAGGTSRYYRIEYSLNGGSTWTSINSNYYTSSSSPTYNWTMPNTASNNVLVRVRDKNNLSKTGQNDSPFSISAPITMNVPNLGGTYYVGDTMFINWNSNGTSNYYNIDYSTNGGTTWTSIVYNHNTSGNSYAWVVPGTISNNCKIKITDNISSCKQTQSSIPFKIVSGTKKITLNSPQGGESWNSCSQQVISWTDSGNSSAYKIQYSTNAGTSWTTIQSSYATSSKTYNWSVPNIVGGSYLVRVSDAVDSSKTDQSDSTFAVSNSVTPVVSAIGNTTICNGNSVTLTCDRTSGVTWYPGGLTSQTISVTTPGGYYVLYSDSNSCVIQSNTISVNTGTPPAAPIITASGPTKFCLGNSVILSANQTSGITWFPGGQTSQTITATQGGTYSVTYADANGCSATSNPTIITTNAIPTITKSQAGVCLGDTLILVSSSATGNRWFPTGDTTATIKVTTNGNYSVQVTDTANCVATSLADTVLFESRPAAPTVVANGPLSFCKGESVILTASPKQNISWSTGLVDSTITIDTANTVYAIYTNAGGCTSESLPVNTNLLSSPTQPAVTAIGNTTFCNGDSVTLVSNAPNNKWNNADTNSNLLVKTSGYYSTTTTGSNGCKSTSDPVLVSVNSVPAKPTVSANGALTFCAGDSVILSSNLTQGNLWSNGDSSTSITVKAAGSYSVTYTNVNGCSAESNPTIVQVESAPVKPALLSSQGNSICMGDTTILSSSYTGKNMWSTGDTTSSINVNQSGNYTVYAIGANGCTSGLNNLSIAVNAIPNNPTITASQSGILCKGDTVELTSSYGSGNMWSNGDSSNSIIVTQNGNYTLSVMDANGCESTTASQSLNFGFKPSTPVISLIGNNTFCQGDSVVLNSNAPNKNLWSNGDTSSSITVKSTGIYSLMVKGTNGCQSPIVQESITVNSNPTAPAISHFGSTTLCQGDSIVLTSSKASGNTWSNNETTPSIVVKNSGIYSVAYSNSNNCSAISSPVLVTVNNNPPKPSLSVVGDTVFCSGDSVLLTSSLLTNNVWSNGDTSKSIVVKSSGNYSVSQTTSFGCTETSKSIQITSKASPAKPVLSLIGDSVLCAGDSTIISSNVNYGLIWNNGDSAAQLSVSNSGLYQVTHTALNGCVSQSKGLTITVNPVPTQPTISANGPLEFCSGNDVLLSSSATNSNTWSDQSNGNTLLVSSAGNYSVTVNNSFGCEATSSIVNVTVNTTPSKPQLLFSGDTTLCSGDSVVISTNYSQGLNWSTGDTTSSITLKNNGFYYVSYTDTNNCSSSSRSVQVVSNVTPAKPIISSIGSLEFCQGGSVTLSSSSSVNNKWSNGDTASSIIATSGGNYSVDVENQFGCKASSNLINVKVNQLPNKPSLLITGDTLFCQGDSVVLNTNYSNGIQWSNGDTTSQITVFNSGFYSVTHTDSNNCQAVSKSVQTVSNSIPTTPTILASGPLTFCAGGTVTLSSSSSNMNKWSNGDTSNSVIVNQSGNFSVEVNNAFGCKSVSTNTFVTVNQNPSTPSITASGPTTFCQGDSVTLSSSKLTQNIWSTTDTSSSIKIKSSGVYSLKSVDGNGCESSLVNQVVSVNAIPTAPVISANGALGFCQGDSVTLVSNALTGNIWSNGDTTQSILVKNSGTFNVKLTTPAKCEVLSNSLIVQVGALPQTPSISSIGSTKFCAGDSVTLVSSRSTGNVWSTGDVTNSIVVYSAKNIGLKVQDNGCISNEATQFVNVLNNPTPPSISFTGDTLFCSGDSVILHSSYATGNLWSHSAGSDRSIVVTTKGAYYVTHTDTNGCSSTSLAVSTNLYPTTQAPFVSPGGTVEICEGDTAKLWSDVSSGISWNINQSPMDTLWTKQAGSFYVDYTDGNGCQVQSNVVTVTTLVPPAKPIVTKVGPDLESSASNSYQWLFGGTVIPGAIGQSHRPEYNGVYQVIIFDGNGCRASSDPSNFNSVGLDEMSFIESLKLYPNPTNGDLTMDLSLVESKEIDIVIMNLNGQIVHQENIKPMELEITRRFDLNDLSNGIYQFELRTNDSSYSERITINK